MISANGGLPAHRYTPQVTQRWPRGSEPASLVAGGRGLVWRGSCDPCCGGLGVPLGFVGQAGVRGVVFPGGLTLGPVSSGGPCP